VPNIAFIGAGNMGLPMLENLIKAGNQVTAFDLSDSARNGAAEAGAIIANSPKAAVKNKEIVVTMLPAGPEAHAVYMGDSGIIAHVSPGTLLIDCSTIDVLTSRNITKAAEAKGLEMLDAPVSGGVMGAKAGTLTFMVGGTKQAFDRAEAVLLPMAKTVVYAGPAGNGQAAKICNNMMLAAGMIVTSEAFRLADSLGLDRQTMFDISSRATGQCWALTNYCPVPGPVPASPANNDYRAGFTAAMMAKDLALAMKAAEEAGISAPLGAEAERLYSAFCVAGYNEVDFSGIFRFVESVD
jgi:3-hydroxyisobutyrate dehydrogenase